MGAAVHRSINLAKELPQQKNGRFCGEMSQGEGRAQNAVGGIAKLRLGFRPTIAIFTFIFNKMRGECQRVSVEVEFRQVGHLTARQNQKWFLDSGSKPGMTINRDGMTYVEAHGVVMTIVETHGRASLRRISYFDNDY